MHRCRDRAPLYLHLASLSQKPKVASEAAEDTTPYKKLSNRQWAT